MARKNANQHKKDPSTIPLKKADRSGPDPSKATLLDLAEKRGLLNPENHRLKDGSLPKGAQRIRPESEEEDIGRLGNAVLWSISMAALHFTFDVLTQHQYSESIVWGKIVKRALEAFLSTVPPTFHLSKPVLTHLSHSITILHPPPASRARCIRTELATPIHQNHFLCW